MAIQLRDQSQCQYDLLALGEIMLRLDPGEGRIRCTRDFKVWEGGGDTTLPAACAGVST